jgi:hypothetical protein
MTELLYHRLDVTMDFDERSLKGTSSLWLRQTTAAKPRTSSGTAAAAADAAVHLHCRQCVVTAVTVNGVPASFRHIDPLMAVVPQQQYRDAEAFDVFYRAQLWAAAGEDTGELRIALPAELPHPDSPPPLPESASAIVKARRDAVDAALVAAVVAAAEADAAAEAAAIEAAKQAAEAAAAAAAAAPAATAATTAAATTAATPVALATAAPIAAPITASAAEFAAPAAATADLFAAPASLADATNAPVLGAAGALPAAIAAAAAPPAAATVAPPPVAAAPAPAPAPQPVYLHIQVSYELHDPSAGLKWVHAGNTSGPASALHCYTTHSHAAIDVDGPRCWFPCLDSPSRACPVELLLTLLQLAAATAGASSSSRHRTPLTPLFSGTLLSEALLLPETAFAAATTAAAGASATAGSLRQRRQYHFCTDTCTPVRHVGLAVGPFRLWSNPHAQRLRGYYLPAPRAVHDEPLTAAAAAAAASTGASRKRRRSEETAAASQQQQSGLHARARREQTVAAALSSSRKLVAFVEDWLDADWPYQAAQQVFVRGLPGRYAVFCGLVLLREELLCDAAVSALQCSYVLQ